MVASTMPRSAVPVLVAAPVAAPVVAPRVGAPMVTPRGWWRRRLPLSPRPPPLWYRPRGPVATAAVPVSPPVGFVVSTGVAGRDGDASAQGGGRGPRGAAGAWCLGSALWGGGGCGGKTRGEELPARLTRRGSASVVDLFFYSAYD